MNKGRSEAFVRLTEFLRRNGVEILPGFAAKDILRVERDLGVRIPASLAAMLQICGGTNADQILNESPLRHIHLWGLHELRIAQEDEAGKWAPAILFADYLIHSIEFGISVVHCNVVAANGLESQEIASSLEEFVDGYIRDDPRVFGSS